MSSLSPHDLGQRILLLTLALQVAVESEHWDEVDTLIENRAEAIESGNGIKIPDPIWQQIRSAEEKAFEGLMRHRGSLLSSMESGHKATFMQRAYGPVTQGADLADF